MAVFFFQAEDGIRDIGVTGVQTCALPIYLARPLRLGRDERGPRLLGGVRDPEDRQRGPRRSRPHLHHRPGRSEERRVGKECRSRWSPYHYKKTTKNRQRARTLSTHASSYT